MGLPCCCLKESWKAKVTVQSEVASRKAPSETSICCTVCRKSCDCTILSAWVKSSLVDNLSATSPQRQGNMLANKPQLA